MVITTLELLEHTLTLAAVMALVLPLIGTPAAAVAEAVAAARGADACPLEASL